METLMIQSRTYFTKPNISKLNRSLFAPPSKKAPTTTKLNAMENKIHPENDTFFNYSYSNDLLDENNSAIWINGDLLNMTINNSSDYFSNYNDQVLNSTNPQRSDSWTSCKEWSVAQNGLFQTAHFFFAAAFLIPNSFKMSILIFRCLITIGFIFLCYWAGMEICAPDIVLWYLLLVILNLTHSCLLSRRFFPPTLSLELTELYLKMFKPLRVCKKHYKEFVKEARMVSLKRGDIYAVEGASPADERLSILLKGKLRVTCDDTHLHFINVHQFVDSPEWEANHDHSDDVFQVTITAEEDCVYLCWPRMKLERFLRHRPMLKIVLDCVIGKDITYKLYSLNEHLSGLSQDRIRERRGELWAQSHRRSMSVDAVNTGTTGLVRSSAYKSAQQETSCSSTEVIAPGRKLNAPNWIPFVASQFPVVSPFTHQQSIDSTTSLLRLPEEQTPPPQRLVSFRRDVKF